MKETGKDLIDIAFRGLFSLIFLALGAEHLFSDGLIKRLMPGWLPVPDLLSILAGIALFIGGSLIVVGYKLRFAAVLLASFLVAVTLIVHAPSLMQAPEFIGKDDEWLWLILQRSNYAKNLCLLGVCLLLIDYQPRRWSLENYLKGRSASSQSD